MFLKYSISEIHRKFQSGDLDPLQVAEACISSVSRFNPEYRAWVSFDPEALIKGAKNVRRLIHEKKQLRPLDGIPVGIKDVFNTSDFPTQMGSELWRDFTPGNDARVVYYLKNSGGLIAGKTVTAEFAVHALNETLNPHNVKLTPGTSSSGSAVAVALGMVPVALGTQTGGSIIRPASFCGVYGFKPSFGLIPRTASLKTTDSLDTIGFFVSHPDDLRRVFDVVRVHGPNFPISYRALKDVDRQNKPTGRNWKVALVKTYTWDYAEDYAKTAILNFARELDDLKEIDIIEVDLPGEMQQAHEIHATIYNKSLSYYFIEEYKQSNKISILMKDMIEAGKVISKEKYHATLAEQNILIGAMDKFLLDYDAIICLSTAGSAPERHVQEQPDTALMWTLTHLPSISVPLFKSPNGEPFGLQIVARKYNDLLLMNLVDFLRRKEIIPMHPSPLVKCIEN